MSRTIELAEGITATVSDDVSSATINALCAMATQARYREKHGYLSADPLEIKDGVNTKIAGSAALRAAQLCRMPPGRRIQAVGFTDRAAGNATAP